MNNDLVIKVYHYKPKHKGLGTFIFFEVLSCVVIGKLFDDNQKLRKRIDILEKENKAYKEEE